MCARLNRVLSRCGSASGGPGETIVALWAWGALKGALSAPNTCALLVPKGKALQSHEHDRGSGAFSFAPAHMRKLRRHRGQQGCRRSVVVDAAELAHAEIEMSPT